MAEAKRKPPEPGSSVPVDRSGNPVDPTANVIALTEAANKRQDDLREAADKLNALQITCQKEIGDLREKHADAIRVLQAQHLAEQRKSESERLNSIRQVDREETNKTAVQILGTVTTLAAQNQSTAETLRNQVAQTAEAMRNQVAAAQLASQNIFNQTVGELNKRISQLELSSSEGKGKQTLADPQLVALMDEVRSLNRTGAQGAGKTEGIEKFIGWIVAAAAVGIAYFKGGQ